MLVLLMKWKLPPFKNRIAYYLHVQLFSNITYYAYSKQLFQMDKLFPWATESMSHVHAKHGGGVAHGTMQSNHIDRTS